MMNTEGNTELTNGNERVLVPAADDSYYYTLSQQSGRTGQFVAFNDFSENGRLDVILQKIDSNGIP
jgi:hypothetical protein